MAVIHSEAPSHAPSTPGPDQPGPDQPGIGAGRGLRELLLAVLLLALACGICFHRWSLHPADVLVGAHDGGRTDLTTAYGALRVHQRAAWSDGQWPVWNRNILCGLPVIGNPQSAMWYPPNWLFFRGQPMASVSLLMVFHHWLAGLGAYLLARRHGLQFAPGLLAGLAFLAGPFLVAASAEGHYNQTCLVAWIPWTLLAYERLRAAQPGGKPLTALAIALCFFCGHAQETLYLVLVVTGMVVLDVVRPRSPGRVLGRVELARSWFLVGLLTAGLVAVDLIPIWFYTRQAVRASGITLAQASEISIGPANFLQLLDPLALGGPASYQGPGKFYWETLLHFGIVPLWLAVLAVAARSRQYPVARFAVLALVALLFAMGDRTPLFPVLHRLVPGISYFRAPSRAIYFCTFAVSMLAAFGLQSLMDVSAGLSVRRRTIGALALATSAAICGAAGLLGGLSGPLTGDITAGSDLNLLWPALFTAGLLLSGALMLWRPALAAAAGLAIGLLCLAEDTRHAHRVVASVPQDHFRDTHPIADFLRQRLGDGRVIVAQELLSDREANRFRIRKLEGLEGVPLIRLAVPIVSQMEVEEPVADLMGFARLDLSKYRPQLMQLTGIRYAAVVTGEPAEFEGWEIVGRGVIQRELTLRGDRPQALPYAIYEVKDPMPRAYVQGRTRRLQGAILPRNLRDLRPRESLLVEHDPLPPGARQPLRPARIVNETDTRLQLRCELDAPGFLVLADTYFPGWKATVDGRPADLVPVNLGFRGVALDAGRHEVEMYYEPPGLRIGMIISAIAAAWIMILLVNERKPKR